MPPQKLKRCDCSLCKGALIPANKYSLHKRDMISAAKSAARQASEELSDNVMRLAFTNSTCVVSDRMWGHDNGDETRGNDTAFAAGGEISEPRRTRDSEPTQGSDGACTGSDDLYQGVVALDYELQGHLGALDVLTNASVDLVNFATKDNVDVHANWLSETSRKLREFKTRGDVPTKVLIEAMVDSIAVRMSILEAWRKTHTAPASEKDIFNTGNCPLFSSSYKH